MIPGPTDTEDVAALIMVTIGAGTLFDVRALTVVADSGLDSC
jgi:hypothetical protein